MQSIDQWTFPSSHLQNTATVVVDKQTPHHELLRRVTGIDFLFRVGLQLKLNIPVLATAATFFHRFYMRQSTEGHVVYDVAGASVFLACKVEESGRKLRDVAVVCVSKATGVPLNLSPGESDPAVASWVKTLTMYEELLLETLCFDLTVEHPHHFLLNGAESLQATETTLGWSWSILNDTFRTPLCVLYHPRPIACACYILAVRSTTPDIPLSAYMEDAWAFPVYEAFRLEGSEESQVGEILKALLDFYANIKKYVPDKFWSPNPFERSPDSFASPPFTYTPPELEQNKSPLGSQPELTPPQSDMTRNPNNVD